MRGAKVNGDTIRKLRLSKGFTQEQLAIRADLDVTTLRRMEKGDRAFDIRSLVDLAIALNCDLVHLLADDHAKDGADNHSSLLTLCIERHRLAFLEKNVEKALDCFTDDAVITFPTSIPSESSGRFEGKDQIREHLILTFQTFTPEIPTLEESDVYVFENLVIVRHYATATVLHNGARFGSECLFEYWFRDGKIYKYVGMFDTAAIAAALNAPPETPQP